MSKINALVKELPFSADQVRRARKKLSDSEWRGNFPMFLRSCAALGLNPVGVATDIKELSDRREEL